MLIRMRQLNAEVPEDLFDLVDEAVRRGEKKQDVVAAGLRLYFYGTPALRELSRKGDVEAVTAILAPTAAAGLTPAQLRSLAAAVAEAHRQERPGRRQKGKPRAG